MKPADIDALVNASLEGPRSVHTGHVGDPKSYVAKIEAEFCAKRVPPELEVVVLEREVAEPRLSPGLRDVYMICRSDPQSVFFDPETMSFGCAWGPQLPDMKYVDLGFRSQDVLEMLSA